MLLQLSYILCSLLLRRELKGADDPAFEGGLKYDPVDVASIWLGRDYLNMILNVKLNVNGGKQHVFRHSWKYLSEFETNGTVNMLLYHDANGDEEYYNRRAYLLCSAINNIADAENPGQKITIKFKYYTYDKRRALQ